MLDIDVELEAEVVFRVSAVVSAILDILEGNPEIFGSGVYRDLGEVRSVGRVLEKLLVGLVPIRGRSVEYSVLDDGETEWLVHKMLVEKLDKEAASEARPLYVVGVAEQALFWRDTRRVLFSKSRFRVFSRLSRDGVHDTWTPVKLAQVLETVVPGLGRQIETLGSGALVAMSGASAVPGSEELRRERFNSALVGYAGLLAAHYGRTIAEDDLIQAGLPSEGSSASYGSLPGRREAFGEMAQFVCDRFGIEREELLLAQYRGVALSDAELDHSANLLSSAGTLERTEEAPRGEKYLDTEFVAIYW